MWQGNRDRGLERILDSFLKVVFCDECLLHSPYKRWMHFVHVWNNTIWNSNKALIYAQNVKPGASNKVNNSLRIAPLQGHDSKCTVHPACPAVRRQCHPSCWRQLPTSWVWVAFKLWTWWITGARQTLLLWHVAAPQPSVPEKGLALSYPKSPRQHFLNW